MLSLAVALCAAGSAPNVLFIMADDLGFADAGYKSGVMPTPHIDRLAKESIDLEQYYVHPVCTPTRAALLTGRNAAGVGMPGPFLVGVPAGLGDEYETIGQSMQERGYHTMMSGKWHVGHAAWSHVPTRKGFERFFGFYSAAEGHYSKVRAASTVSITYLTARALVLSNLLALRCSHCTRA